MIGRPARDDEPLARALAYCVVEDRKFECGLDCFGAPAGKVETVDALRSPAREALDQSFAGGGHPNWDDIVKARHLFSRKLRDLFAALTDVDHHRSRSAVEDLLAVPGVQVGAFGALDVKRLARYAAHEESLHMAHDTILRARR